MGAIMLSTLLAVVAVQASVQLPPQERENRNRLIVHILILDHLYTFSFMSHAYVIQTDHRLYRPSTVMHSKYGASCN